MDLATLRVWADEGRYGAAEALNRYLQSQPSKRKPKPKPKSKSKSKCQVVVDFRTDLEPLWAMELPLPPPENRLFRNTFDRGGRAKTREYLDWIREADARFQIVPWARVEIAVMFVARLTFSEKRGDVGNYLKALPDRLEANGVLTNDKLIEPLVIVPDYGSEPGARIYLYAIPEAGMVIEARARLAERTDRSDSGELTE